MMNKKLMSVFLVGVSVVGCAGANFLQGGDKKAAAKKDVKAVVEDKAAIDQDLQKLLASIEFTDKKAEMSADGRIQVQSKVVNKTDGLLKIFIQTQFKDEQGQVVDQTNFEPAIIPARAYHMYTAQSLNTKARNYEIKIKRG